MNAFFVRDDFADEFKVCKRAEEIWEDHNVRQSKGKDGTHTFLNGARRREEINGLKVFDRSSGNLKNL